MILGIDLGNYAVKTSLMHTFPSKVSRTPGILKNTTLETDQGTFYIGEGSFDTEYRKAKKESIRVLFLYACALSGQQNIRACVGLPISQFKQDRDTLKAVLLQQGVNYLSLNGKAVRVILDDLEVYPEGLAAIYGTEFEGVAIDIGGGTTDAFEILNGKISNPFSLPQGIRNLENDFIKLLNSRGLDLRPEDAQRIIKTGLKVDGEPVDVGPAMEVFRSFVDNLVSRLQIEYSIRTRDVLLIGGGCELLYKAIRNRIPAAKLINNSVFANAAGLERVGRSIWG